MHYKKGFVSEYQGRFSPCKHSRVSFFLSFSLCNMYENVGYTSRILSLLCLKQKQCKYKPRGYCLVFFVFVVFERIEIFMLIQTKFVQTICLELFSYQIFIFPNTRTRSDSQKFLHKFKPLIFYLGQKSFFLFGDNRAGFWTVIKVQFGQKRVKFSTRYLLNS